MIRHAAMEDVEAIAELERICFPPAEAATYEQFAERVRAYGDGFWLLEQDGNLLSFVDGMATDERELTDGMYENPHLHNPDGAWQMIFGVNTRPDVRRRGIAMFVLERVILDSFLAGRQGLVLTCKEQLLGFYARLGFVNEGISSSEHGGAVWYSMRLVFSDVRVCVADTAERTALGLAADPDTSVFIAWSRDRTCLGYAVRSPGQPLRVQLFRPDPETESALRHAAGTRRGRTWA